jgi:hypothetical protein
MANCIWQKIWRHGTRVKKTGQKGTNMMIVMTHDEISHTLAAKIFLLTQIQSLIIALKRTIPTKFESWQAVT